MHQALQVLQRSSVNPISTFQFNDRRFFRNHQPLSDLVLWSEHTVGFILRIIIPLHQPNHISLR